MLPWRCSCLPKWGRKAALSDLELATTSDRLLGGRVRLRQPTTGYRAAIDPVLLAAAVSAKPGERILDLGCGVGAASLCLLARLADLRVTGWDVQPELVDLARQNASSNQVANRFSVDCRDVAGGTESARFHQVITNPPFHDGAASDAPAHPGKRRAVIEHDLDLWLNAAGAVLPHRGRLTMIFRADRLDVLIRMLGRGRGGQWGGIVVWPCWPRQGVAAKRVLVRAVKGSRAGLTLGPGLVLHGADGRFTEAAETILRHGGPLIW